MTYALTNLIIEENKRTIVALLQSTHRKGMDNVIHYLNDSVFFIIPPSLHRHHNLCGGLAQHSLGVYMTARENSEILPKDSVIIACLLHDICKAGKYYYDSVGNIYQRLVHIHGHGYRSVKLLEKFGLILTDDERRAIRWHMGGHHANDKDIEDVTIVRKIKLWKVVHEADQWDARGKNLNISTFMNPE